MPTSDIPAEIARLLPDAEEQLKVFGNALGKPFDYSLESLGRLEHVLTEAWPEPPRKESTLDMMVQLFGAYFGESLRPHHPECKLFPFPVIYQKLAHHKPIENWVTAYCIASQPEWKPK